MSTEAFVALQVGDVGWLVDLVHLREASVPPPIARTGRSPAWVTGIGSFRGQVHTVIDMGQILSDQRTIAPHLAWATPLHPRHGVALALLWPDMVGLLPKTEFQPASGSSAEPWVAKHWSDGEGRVWREFNMEAFLASEHGDGRVEEESR